MFPRVVYDHTYVFLDELPGLPLRQEIEFVIVILIDMSHIALPMYCMTPAESAAMLFHKAKPEG